MDLQAKEKAVDIPGLIDHLVSMNSSTQTLHLQKESFKFSSSHFTVFGEDNFERLHGHNYYVAVEVEFAKIDENLEMAVDFRRLKKDIQELCDQFDEYILVAENSDYFDLKKEDNGYWYVNKNKRYFFPEEDLKILPLKNITCEALSDLFTTHLATQWKELAGIRTVTVRIQETSGQSVSTKTKLGES